MDERRWIEERRWEVDGIWRVVAGGRTDAEVLAEMPVEALVAEFKRRGHRVVMDEKALPTWVEWLAKESADG